MTSEMMMMMMIHTVAWWKLDEGGNRNRSGRRVIDNAPHRLTQWLSSPARALEASLSFHLHQSLDCVFCSFCHLTFSIHRPGSVVLHRCLSYVAACRSHQDRVALPQLQRLLPHLSSYPISYNSPCSIAKNSLLSQVHSALVVDARRRRATRTPTKHRHGMITAAPP